MSPTPATQLECFRTLHRGPADRSASARPSQPPGDSLAGPWGAWRLGSLFGVSPNPSQFRQTDCTVGSLALRGMHAEAGRINSFTQPCSGGSRVSPSPPSPESLLHIQIPPNILHRTRCRAPSPGRRSSECAFLHPCRQRDWELCANCASANVASVSLSSGRFSRACV